MGQVKPTFDTKTDFAHMCCAADLIAGITFLQGLEMDERRDVVSSACLYLNWSEQRAGVRDEPSVEEDVFVDAPLASGFDFTYAWCMWHFAGGELEATPTWPTSC